MNLDQLQQLLDKIYMAELRGYVLQPDGTQISLGIASPGQVMWHQSEKEMLIKMLEPFNRNIPNTDTEIISDVVIDENNKPFNSDEFQPNEQIQIGKKNPNSLDRISAFEKGLKRSTNEIHGEKTAEALRRARGGVR